MYLWIDLETTGLDPDNDRIIEVGWFISSGFEQLTPEQSVLITPDKIAWELMQQDLFVQTMHTENGLIKDMESFGTIVVEDADDTFKLGTRYAQFITELTNAYVVGDPDA
jgi:oligoribonuclease (3'-5' exoribonuclease)